jgi:hypothetical protein
MLRSILNNMKRAFFTLLILHPVALFCAFGPGMGEKEWLDWSNKCLTDSYNPARDTKLKKWEISITPEHFIHFRKTYQHGKQLYYSIDLKQLDTINYQETPAGGQLKFKTLQDDIIVQTYDDPKGNIDSMSTELSIPVKGISPERLDSLNDAIKYFKEENL